MKRIVISCAFMLGISSYAQAQTLPPGPSQTDAIKQSEAVKTMDRQQVITNYLQAVAGNITNDTKTVQLKATVFALNPKDSAAKYLDSYYLNNYWQRNLQFVTGSALDKSSNLNGFNAGVSYNVSNRRDATTWNVYNLLDVTTRTSIRDMVAQAVGTYTNTAVDKMSGTILQVTKNHFKDKNVQDLSADILQAVNSKYFPPDVSSDPTFITRIQALTADLQKCIDSGNFDLQTVKYSSIWLLADFFVGTYVMDNNKGLNSELTAYCYSIDKNGKEPDGMSSDLKYLVSQINVLVKAKSATIHGTDLVSVYTYLHKDYQKKLNQIAKKPMITFGYTYTYRTTGTSYQHTPSFTFLKGIGKNETASSLELSIVGTDTTETDSIKKRVGRDVATLQVGLDKIFFTDAKSTSLLEMKLALEGDDIWHGRYTGEKEVKGYASLTLQGRPSAKSPWFKLGIKYNKKANFLGFLNVTLNLDNSANKGGS